MSFGLITGEKVAFYKCGRNSGLDKTRKPKADAARILLKIRIRDQIQRSREAKGFMEPSKQIGNSHVADSR
jgi:hypothetical protein